MISSSPFVSLCIEVFSSFYSFLLSFPPVSAISTCDQYPNTNPHEHWPKSTTTTFYKRVPTKYQFTSMYFWSVSWSTNCPVYFSFFGRPKRNCPVSETGQKNFGQSLNFFWSLSLLEGEQKSQRLAKKNSDTNDQNFFCLVSETGQFFLVDQKNEK